MTITSAGLSISAGPVFLTQDVDGIAVIPDTPLTWTNFFDGRPMRATDFTAEQQAGIDHTRLTARAGGVGVSWGYDVVRPSLTKDQAGETLRIEPGLAIDPDGRALCLTQRIEMSIPELLAATTQTTHALGTQSGDAACGSSPSRLCLQLCVSSRGLGGRQKCSALVWKKSSSEHTAYQVRSSMPHSGS